MDTDSTGWWRRHGWTIALLLSAFGLAFAVRTIWAYPIIERWGALYTYAGGSDSYYHSRVTTYIIQTGHNLVYDPMLRFPVGSINPREPLFDWMNAILGILFAPFFGGNAVTASAWFLDLQAPLWAALEVFPIYLIGREVSSRRTGLIAALVFPFFSSSIDSSTFGYANYLSFYTFMLLVAVYAALRMVKVVGHTRYVESYRHPGQYLPALRAFFRNERTAVKWAVFTGVSLGALALSWQGYTYVIVVIGIGLLVAMLIERLRRVDSFGLYVSTWIVGLVAFPMAAPYYLVQHEVKIFLVVPILLFFGILALLLPFLLLRDVPWVFSIPTLVGVVAAGVAGLSLASPGLFSKIVTGQGYFVKTLVYTTVAEAQAPSIDQLIVAYGVVTFFLAFVGLALFAYLIVHHRFRRQHLFFMVYLVISVYLPISATKFFLVGTPAFALLSGEAIRRALDVGSYPKLRRNVASLADRGSRFAAFRKSFKARHVLVLVLVVGLVLPNIWVAIDAGIPANNKGQLATEINNTIPTWLKLNASAPGSNYLGAAGSALDTPNQYDSAAYNWLASQDTNVPEPKRPAFISWWDYGFQAIDQGQHPSVADNFQNGIDPAGQFLLSQNESLAISILSTTLLQGELQETRSTSLPSALDTILAADGVNVTILNRLLTNEASDYQTVVHHPAVYLPVNPSTLSLDNAMYLAVSHYLAGTLSLSQVSKAYDDIQAFTGWSIRYAMVDSRLFPFSGSNTGIFYAPADLTGRVISSSGIPTTFFNVSILGSDNNVYPLGQLPAGVTAVRYNINYSSPFYRSMLYRIYIGYNGTDVGQSSGIPGLTGSAQSDPLMPGWMLQHFEVVYRTAYVCPYQSNPSPSSSCYVPTNLPTAEQIANKTNGSADTSATSFFQGGEAILAYYAGEPLLGTVRTPSGTPASGIRVTVYDGSGIPHMTAVTTADGTFSLVLPPGNDTLNFTSGPFDKRSQGDANVLSTVNLTVPASVGFSLNAAPMVRTFQMRSAQVNALVYFNVGNNSTFIPHVDPVLNGAKVVLTGVGGSPVLTGITDPSGSYQFTDVPPQVYNVTVNYAGNSYSQPSLNATPGGVANISAGLDPGLIAGKVTDSNGAPASGATVTISNASGVVATTTVGSTGGFSVRRLAPGAYHVYASFPGSPLRSATVPVTLNASGGLVSVNLQLASRGSVSVQLSFNGVGVASVPVRFVPISGLVNGSLSGVATLEAATATGALATTGPTGFASLTLDPGTYGVYALGLVNGERVTGYTLLTVFPGASIGPFPIPLSPAVPVTVTVGGELGPSNASRTAVIVYASNGFQLLSWAAANETAQIWLPAGSYSFASVHGTSTTGSTSLVALASVAVAEPSTSVHLQLQNAVTTHFAVGAPGPHATFAGTEGAEVVVSAGPGGPFESMVSGVNGATGLVLPAVPPGSSTGYCVNITTFGFAQNTTCGWSPTALAQLSLYDLKINPVAVTLKVLGLPKGTNVTVNFTGKSPTAVNLTLVGGPLFSLSLPPGVYGVGASAVIGNGTTVYLPSSVLSTTIPLGATYSNLTLTLIPEINASGRLVLPTGATLAGTTVNLTSSLLNVSVNGTAFTTSFRATPANYTATVSTTVGSVHYVNLTRVTVAANGAITPKLVLSATGVKVRGTLVDTAGTALTLGGRATLRGSGGVTTVVTVGSGTFSGFLPPGSYAFQANFSSVTSGPNGSFTERWSPVPGASCTFTANASSCRITMVGSVPPLAVHGRLTSAGLPTLLSGVVRLVGPYPSDNVTVVPATLGSFSAELAPGAYYVYAEATSTANLAGFGRLLALPNAPVPSIALGPTWSLTLPVSVASGGTQTQGLANVTVQDAFGNRTLFVGVPVGTSVSLPVPLGTYTVSAVAPGSLNGVAGTASARASVALLNGNAIVPLLLAVPASSTVSAALVGSSSVSVPVGGYASFSFSLSDSGNVPVTVHPVGSPSSWGFNFSFSNVTLAPGGPAYAGEVVLKVPKGTFVAHAPVAITFELANGTVAGSVSPAPTVQVFSYFGIRAAHFASQLAHVGPRAAIVAFSLINTGNVLETANLSVVNTARLATLGWRTSILVAGRPLPSSGLVSLAAGANDTVTVNLSANRSVALPPGSVTVEATVENASGSIASVLTLKVPTASLATSGPVTVTGPSIAGGPPTLPDWFVPVVSFLPAIALAVGLSVRRWWKTRRWVRR